MRIKSFFIFFLNGLKEQFWSISEAKKRKEYSSKLIYWYSNYISYIYTFREISSPVFDILDEVDCIFSVFSPFSYPQLLLHPQNPHSMLLWRVCSSTVNKDHWSVLLLVLDKTTIDHRHLHRTLSLANLQEY